MSPIAALMSIKYSYKSGPLLELTVFQLNEYRLTRTFANSSNSGLSNSKNRWLGKPKMTSRAATYPPNATFPHLFSFTCRLFNVQKRKDLKYSLYEFFRIYLAYHAIKNKKDIKTLYILHYMSQSFHKSLLTARLTGLQQLSISWAPSLEPQAI
jgi:hypothetical protein